MGVYDLIKDTNIITIPQGSDVTGTITVKTPSIADPAVLVPMDLTGYVIRGKLRSLHGNEVGTIACTNPAPLTGVISFAISKTVSTPLVPAADVQHVWGFELVAADGTKIPEIQGGAIVTPRIVI